MGVGCRIQINICDLGWQGQSCYLFGEQYFLPSTKSLIVKHSSYWHLSGNLFRVLKSQWEVWWKRRKNSSVFICLIHEIIHTPGFPSTITDYIQYQHKEVITLIKVWDEIIYPFQIQRQNRWSLGVDTSFHPILYWACDYLPIGYGLSKRSIKCLQAPKAHPAFGRNHCGFMTPHGVMEFGRPTGNNHKPNQCWLFWHQTFRRILQWNFISKLFIQESVMGIGDAKPSSNF